MDIDIKKIAKDVLNQMFFTKVPKTLLHDLSNRWKRLREQSRRLSIKDLAREIPIFSNEDSDTRIRITVRIQETNEVFWKMVLEKIGQEKGTRDERPVEEKEQQLEDRNVGENDRIADLWLDNINSQDVFISIWSLQNVAPLDEIPVLNNALRNFMRQYWGKRKRKTGEGKLPTYKKTAQRMILIDDSDVDNLVFWKAFFDEAERRLEAMAPQQGKAEVFTPKRGVLILLKSPRRSRSPSPILWESPRRERSRSPSPIPPKEKEEESDRDRRNRLKREKRTQDRARQNNAVRQYEDFMEKVFSGPNMLEIRLARYSAVPYEGADMPSLDEQVALVKNWLRYEWFSKNEGWPTAKQIAKGASEGEFYQFKKRAFSTPLRETGKKQRINACVACAAPLENTNRYACGAGCKTVLYCGQDCADAHWEEHNCRLVKE